MNFSDWVDSNFKQDSHTNNLINKLPGLVILEEIQ
jgi:hypothetical protein